MKRSLLIGLAGTLTLILLAGAASALPAEHHLQLKLSPSTIALEGTTTIRVTGVHASSVAARLAGGSQYLGRLLPWTQLRSDRGGWSGELGAPEFLGIYPVELRVRLGSTVIRVKRSRLRVFAPGTLGRPTFGTPEGVARWWFETLPASLHATLTALRRWQRPAFDRRDPRLHQLLVVAYATGAGDTLGMFVTAARDTPGGRWRLLEATVEP
jgi:hypothetical protein